MGGRISQLGALSSDAFSACVMFYGRPETGPAVLAKLRAPLLGHFGAQDRGIGHDQVEALRAGLKKAGKPAGEIYEYPGAGHASGTLVNALLHHMSDLSGIGGELRPGIVHRLDRGTSGVMVVAKNDAAHRELARQFHDREIEKEYIALVWGVVQAGRRIDAAIGRDTSNRHKMSARARHAREAVTRITRAHHLPGLTLCQVAIHTGRTHQIRVHLSAIGHPVVGDAMYGGVHRRVAGDIRAVQRLERPFLHAARLAFKHPTDQRRLDFVAPLADDLTAVLNDLPGWADRDE